ncbi:unnamed protein product, partial [Ceratitis capitata]
MRRFVPFRAEFMYAALKAAQSSCRAVKSSRVQQRHCQLPFDCRARVSSRLIEVSQLAGGSLARWLAGCLSSRTDGCSVDRSVGGRWFGPPLNVVSSTNVAYSRPVTPPIAAAGHQLLL